MRVLSVIVLLAALILPTVAFAEVQTFTATHTYILGDHDSKDDARQRCLFEAKRKILEQAGVYIESASEVMNFDLTKDKITSFAAAVMQVKDAKEEVSFQQGHMTMTLTLTAQVDLTEVRKQLAARKLDAGVRDDMAAQKERLKFLEAQLEAMQEQQVGQAPQSRTGLPLDLDYFMSRQQVLSHLKAFDVYRSESGVADTVAYVIPPTPDANTKNGLFLKFSGNKRVEIASMKSDMSKPLHETYMGRLLSEAQQWKTEGAATVQEDKNNYFYLYRDNKSYITISGSAAPGSNGKYSVKIAFTERRFHDKKFSVAK
jgi:hypothetical protein